MTHRCHTEALCNNTASRYQCKCDEGLFGDGFNCTDSNECGDVNITTFVGVTDPAYNSHECHAVVSCHNSYSAYNCSCNDGFEGDGFYCTNVDECALELDTCHQNATCIDTYGDYNCTCDLGYEGDGFNYTDVNECKNSMLCSALQSLCDEFADCVKLQTVPRHQHHPEYTVDAGDEQCDQC